MSRNLLSPPARQGLFETNRVVLVLAVGANRGQYVRFLRDSGYRGEIISLEPIPSVFEELKKARSNDRLWCGHNCALGATAHRAQFKVSENTVSSSLLDVTDHSTHALNATRSVETIDVEVRSLHGAVGDFLLQLDTQGSELDVIEGSGTSLAHGSSIECELSLIRDSANITVTERLYTEGYRAISQQRFSESERRSTSS